MNLEPTSKLYEWNLWEDERELVRNALCSYAEQIFLLVKLNIGEASTVYEDLILLVSELDELGSV